MSNSNPATVLVVDDEANLRKVLAALLRREGYEVLTASDGEEALQLLQYQTVDVILSDQRMPKVDGLTLLKEVMDKHSDVPVIILTAHGSVDSAVEAIKLGAFDYLTKPFDKDELQMVIRKALATAELRVNEPEPNAPNRWGLIGKSEKLDSIFKTIEKVAGTPSTVLITGESGTGKELVAAAIHNHSTRKDKPFIRINCAAIPRELIESELFGYEKGAFTGAVGSKPGRFELAHEGTLFLDEIGEIPIEMQVKLLRALQESEFERVGGVTTTKVDVRLIAATNRRLDKEIETGRFREDLYYRLNVVPIALPPLRERNDDIPSLVDHFLEKYNERLAKEPKVETLHPEALQKLMSYRWPGNIRELENVIERAVLFAEAGIITVDELPDPLRDPPETEERPSSPPAESLGVARVGPLKEIVRQHTENLEKDLISRALDETGGNVTKAAQKLSISRKSLQNKMKGLKLREQDATSSTEG